MARRRFFVDAIEDGAAVLAGDDARHLARVLRAEAGQQYEISDNQSVYLAEIAEARKDRIVLRVLEPLPAPAIPVDVTLVAALIKFDRFEWMIEKVTELGVAAIVPVEAARTEKGLLAAAAKRVERWRRIARESSEQSRRARMPVIRDPVRLPALPSLNGWSAYLEEQPGAPPLLEVLPSPAPSSATLLIGPEGGWTESERSALAGIAAVSLGPLILRAETAAIAALAAIESAAASARYNEGRIR